MNVFPRIRHTRTAPTVVALLSLAALTACGDQSADEAKDGKDVKGTAAAAAAPPPATSFTENGVTVTLSVTDWHTPKGTLTAVFTPEKKGFHLYSTELPPTGVEGVGRPTAVGVTGVLKADGKLTAAADVRSVNVPGVDAPMPVYPDGPVTTTLPIRADGNGDATVLLGYASCSTKEGCTIPVADHPVHLRLTDDGPAFAAH
ncbi:hypothetical protein OG304_36385 [Streptomyces sp. NBC_00160]|uniref:hypothetical protein n=1 Tax=Streptomyces sp. NBC_00160 TaxID=2903628 RepID=UPI0022515D53|nr:hypothetical protein [Streptomyces sp. NBC_00160]MCX5308866.1 hypothetical protein [Streptomyces sp. NBC_00160]